MMTDTVDRGYRVQSQELETSHSDSKRLIVKHKVKKIQISTEIGQQTLLLNACTWANKIYTSSQEFLARALKMFTRKDNVEHKNNSPS